MSVALYRKYRPTEFSEIVGQKYIVKAITNALKNDKLSHAYLFTGPRGVGKTSMARLIAKAINGIDEESIDEIVNGRHIDVVEIDAASNRGVDEIRNLRENIKYMPLKAKMKIYIIDEVHMLTNEAFNALLKTLEEPPKHTIFILATTEIEKIPATVISRCQRYDFTPITLNDMIELFHKISSLENVKIDDESIELIFEKSEGSVRDSFSIYEKLIDSFYGEEITKEKTEEVLGFIPTSLFYDFKELIDKKNIDELLDYSNKLWKNGINIENFLKGFSNYLKKYGSEYIDIIKIVYDNLYTFRFEEDKRLVIYLIAKEIADINNYKYIKVEESPKITIKTAEVNTNIDKKQSIDKVKKYFLSNGYLLPYTIFHKNNIDINDNNLIIKIEAENNTNYMKQVANTSKDIILKAFKELFDMDLNLEIVTEKIEELDKETVDILNLFKGTIIN